MASESNSEAEFLYMLCESLFEQAVGLLELMLSNYQGLHRHSRTQRSMDRHPCYRPGILNLDLVV
jgi:hypothetical protein